MADLLDQDTKARLASHAMCVAVGRPTCVHLRVAELEAEGLTTSDAQSAAEAEKPTGYREGIPGSCDRCSAGHLTYADYLTAHRVFVTCGRCGETTRAGLIDANGECDNCAPWDSKTIPCNECDAGVGEECEEDCPTRPPLATAIFEYGSDASDPFPVDPVAIRKATIARIRARIGQTALARPDQPWRMIREILDEEANR